MKRLAIRSAAASAFCLSVAALLVASVRNAAFDGASELGAITGLALLCLYYMFRSVTQRERAEVALRRLDRESDVRIQERLTEREKATERYLNTLDRMLAGCQLIDFEWRYLYVNEAVARQGWKTKGELLGRTLMECFPGIEATTLFAALRRCMDERALSHMEHELTLPDGTVGWFELSIQPVPEGTFIVSIDITERKQAEMNVQRQLARLQSLRAIDASILRNTDLQTILKTVLEEAKVGLQVDGAEVQLLNPESLMLEEVASIGDRGNAPSESSGGAGRMYSTPLVAKGELIGAFNATFRSPFHADQDWIDFFKAIAGQTAVAIESGKLFADLQRTHLDLQAAYDTTIEGWSRALDLRDKETEGHTQRVTELTVKLARAAGMSAAELLHVKRGALLHDIGKMGVPDHILLKPDKLTTEEWELMRKHPTYAYELLKPIEYLHDALDIPYCHHEKWDGSGYPRGLKGEEIPLAARLFTVVDVWDAIRSDRPYRKGWGEARALEFIRSVSGTHLDPAAVELFMSLPREERADTPVEASVER